MNNYSTTQATNLAALAGFILLILNYFKINIAQDEIQVFLGATISLGGVLWNWYHRYQKGDLKLSGVRK